MQKHQRVKYQCAKTELAHTAIPPASQLGRKGWRSLWQRCTVLLQPPERTIKVHAIIGHPAESRMASIWYLDYSLL